MSVVLRHALDDYLAVASKATPSQARILERLARSAEPKLQRAFLAAVAEVQGGTQVAEVRRLLDAGQVEAALDAVPWARLGEPVIRGQLVRQLRDVFEGAGTAVAGTVARDAEFSIVNPRPAQWVAENGARLVTQIGEETQAGLRATLAEARAQGLSTHRAATLVKQHVGLTEPHARAVMNMRNRLAEEGMSVARIEREARAYTRQLHQVRGMMIARTEAQQAASAGKREAWDQAAEQGLLDPNVAQREWNTAQDSEVRDAHRIHGQVAEFNGTFRLNDGERVPDAPWDPNCRCFTTLIPRGGRELTNQ